MIDHGHLDPDERTELTEQDLAVATLVGRYVERREAGRPPCAHDLLAGAAEFGESAVDALRTVLACYEAMRISDALTPVRGPLAMTASARSSPKSCASKTSRSGRAALAARSRAGARR